MKFNYLGRCIILGGRIRDGVSSSTQKAQLAPTNLRLLRCQPDIRWSIKGRVCTAAVVSFAALLRKMVVDDSRAKVFCQNTVVMAILAEYPERISAVTGRLDERHRRSRVQFLQEFNKSRLVWLGYVLGIPTKRFPPYTVQPSR